MAIITDRRKTANRDRTPENRGRLLRRYKSAVKEQLPKILGDRKLLDNLKGGGKIVIPKKDLSEPQFTYGEGGMTDTVLPGNDRWAEYDTIGKPSSGDGSGTEGDDGMDEFSIVLSREEFINLLFEDCELPFMIDTLLTKQTEIQHENAGFQVAGSPSRLSIIRSYKNSKVRRMSSGSTIQAQIDELEAEMSSILSDIWKANTLNLASGPTVNQEDRLNEIKVKIEELKIRKHALPLFDTTDMCYRCRVEKKVPKTHATMIMVMDNSGSMGEREKTIARKFFILLYLFLDKNYDQIDMRFVSHTTTAKEMGEEEFFSTHENGGTIVSSALDNVIDIIDGVDTVGTPDGYRGKGPLKGKTNIYIAQVSDGDNTETDNGTCSELLTDDILPYVNYFAYVQVEQEGSTPGLLSYSRRNSLWSTYDGLGSTHANMVSKKVAHERDIFGVFRSFFTAKS
jgi:hypothetical protein